MRRALALLFVAFAAAGCSTTERPELAVVAVEPETIPLGEETLIELRGFFPAAVSVDLDDDGPPSLDTGFAVEVGELAIDPAAVTQLGRSTLEVLVPPSLEEGSYDIAVFSPRGESDVLESALSITP